MLNQILRRKQGQSASLFSRAILAIFEQKQTGTFQNTCMPAPFCDITLYLNTGTRAGTDEYREETRVVNYISDLYCQCMAGYKPPGCSRVTIQPYYHKIRKRTWKTGSIIAIAPAFEPGKFEELDKTGKFHYLLEIIQQCMLLLSKEYHWDVSVFEKAHALVLEKNFIFNFAYPPTLSKSRKMSAFVSIEKTGRVTTLYANINTGDSKIKVILYEKANSFWYDCSYILTRHTKWFDSERFGIHYPKGKISVWYSLTDKVVCTFQDDLPVEKIDFRRSFWMQPD